MAGGTGGTGGSPSGVTGATGLTTNSPAAGGTGGQNVGAIIDGSTQFGPYGRGGDGADSNSTGADSGNPGAVIITWGGGVSGTAGPA